MYHAPGRPFALGRSLGIEFGTELLESILVVFLLARARIGSIVKSAVATNSAATIQFSGVTGYQYDVQRATNLNSPITWTTTTTSPLSPAPDGSFTFTNAPPGTAYYRTLERP